MAAHAYLKNEFKEDEKYHNLMSWLILKSGPVKPKLEAVNSAQLSVANLGILYRLLGEGKLDTTGILDYLSYTTKVCQ